MRSYVAFMIAALLIGSLRSACLRNTSLTLWKSHNTSKATSGNGIALPNGDALWRSWYT
jgi:hypothetical protein